MTTENQTPPAGGNGTPAPAAAPPAEPPKSPAIETISMPKDAFDERLSKAGDAATRKFLKSLGYEKTEDLQTVLAAAKALQDEKKTEK